MANKIESFVPVVQSDGLNTDKSVSFTGTETHTGAVTFSGAQTVSGATTVSGAETHTGAFFTSSSVNLVPPSGTVVVVGDYGTGQIDLASLGSVTINAQRGRITSQNLIVGSGSTMTFTLVNSRLTANGQVLASISNGSNTGGVPVVSTINNTATGVATITVTNVGTVGVFNGSVVVNFIVLS